MDFSLDDLLEEVEGALSEAPPRQKPSGDDRHPEEGTATESRPSPSGHRDPLEASHHASASTGYPWHREDKISMATEQPAQGAQAGGAMIVAPPSTVPPVLSALDVVFDSDSSEEKTPVPRTTTAVGVDFDDPATPEISPETRMSGAIINASIDPVSNPGSEAAPPPEVGADFDSDYRPTGSASPAPVGVAAHPYCSNAPPAGTQFAAAVGVDFDAVSPAAVAGAVGVGFDEDDEPTSGKTESNGRDGIVDEPPPLVSPDKGSTGDVRENRPGDQPAAFDSRIRQSDGSESPQRGQQQHHAKIEQESSTVPSRSCGEKRVAATISMQDEGGNSGGGVASTTVAATKRRRCGTVCLGGVATGRGHCASSLSYRACDNLRCTDCNFAVLRFDGRAWEGRTDYLFLRNNAPDPAKLSARLQPCAAGCAYACQCSWHNVEDLRILSPTGQPRWACGGH